MSVPPSIEREAEAGTRPIRALPFVPHFLLRELFGWTVALALLAGLSAFYPWELGTKADPFAPAPAGIRPEWYFLWVFQALKYVPSTVFGINGELLILAVLGVGGALVLLVPFWVGTSTRARRGVTWAAAAVLMVMLLLTVLALIGDGGQER